MIVWRWRLISDTGTKQRGVVRVACFIHASTITDSSFSGLGWQCWQWSVIAERWQ